jgi:hypothetical protein
MPWGVPIMMRRARGRRHRSSFFARAARGYGAFMLCAWSRITRRPVDAVALITAAGVSIVIVVNAMFLQSGMRTPFVDAGKSNAKSDSLKFPTPNNPPQVKSLGPNAPAQVITTSTPTQAAAQPAVARRGDAITELIGPSLRIAAVQRALSEYGYGQIKVNGILDSPTSAAIQKFERERNLPGTGRVSDRLIKELAALAGHLID